MIFSDLGRAGFKYINSSQALDRYLLINVELASDFSSIGQKDRIYLLNKLTKVAISMTEKTQVGNGNPFIPRQELLGQCQLCQNLNDDIADFLPPEDDSETPMIDPDLCYSKLDVVSKFIVENHHIQAKVTFSAQCNPPMSEGKHTWRVKILSG